MLYVSEMAVHVLSMFYMIMFFSIGEFSNSTVCVINKGNYKGGSYGNGKGEYFFVKKEVRKFKKS